MGLEQRIPIEKKFSHGELDKISEESKNDNWINKVDEAGDTPLHTAARYNNLELLESMLPYCNNIETTNESGNTVLHILADQNGKKWSENRKKSIDLIQTPISQGVDINKKNNNGWTLAHFAAKHRNIELLKFFKEYSANFNALTIANETPLIIACKNMKKMKNTEEELAAIDFLIDNVSDINVADNEGYSALHYAVKKCNERAVKSLLETGIDVNLRTKKHKLTALHFAVEECNLDLVKILLNSGAVVESQENDELTPLQMSIFGGSSEIVEFLINNGADINYPDKILHFTPLHSSIYQQDRDLFQLLLDWLADINAKGKDGLTPLQLASMLGNFEFTKALIDRGANLSHSIDDEFNSILQALIKSDRVEDSKLKTEIDAIRCGHEKSLIVKMMEYPYKPIEQNYEAVTQLLLDNESDNDSLTTKGWNSLKNLVKLSPFVNILSNRGTDGDDKKPSTILTALHSAIINNFKTVAIALINTGADVNALTPDGKSPIHLALEKNLTEVIKNLISHGANVNYKHPNSKLMPLHMALLNNNRSAAINLIYSGADINALTKNGKSPITLDLESSSFKEGSLENTKILDLLINRGADVNRIEPYSQSTPIYTAMKAGYKEAIRILLNGGADVNVVSENGRSLIHVASISNDTIVLELLIKHQANLNCKERHSGLTPLHSALYGNHEDAAIILIQAGADFEILTLNGTNSLHLALEFDCKRVVRYLLERGAKLNCERRRCLYTLLYISVLNNDEGRIDQLIDEFSEIPFIMAANSLKVRDVKKAYFLLSALVDARNDKRSCMNVNADVKNSLIEIVSKLNYLYHVDYHDIQTQNTFIVYQVLSNTFMEKSNKFFYYEEFTSYAIMLNAIGTPLTDPILKNYPIRKSVTMYDVLRMKPGRRHFYTNNLDLPDIREWLTSYYKLILAYYYEDQMKTNLLDKFQWAIYRLSNVDLPFPFIDDYYYELSIMDIIATIQAADDYD